MKKLTKLILLLTLLPLVFFSPYQAEAVPDPTGNQTLSWQKASPIGNDLVARPVIYDNSIYIAGGNYDLGSSDTQFHIEKRDLDAGELVSEFGVEGRVIENPTNTYDCIRELVINSSGLYVGGLDFSPGYPNSQWRIEKRDPITGDLINTFGSNGTIIVNPSNSDDEILAMTLDDSGLFIVGYDYAPGSQNSQWRIEKRDLITGGLISNFGTNGIITENISGSYDSPNIAKIYEEAIYFAGYDSSSGNNNGQWRVEEREVTTGALIDEFGNNGVITENIGSFWDDINDITINSSTIYLAGYDSSPGSQNDQWRIEKRDSKTGSLIDAFGTNGVITENLSNSWDWINAIVSDETAIYVAGWDNSPGYYEWRIEKRDLITGALLNNFGTGGAVIVRPEAYNNVAYGIALNNLNLYVVGDVANANYDYYTLLQKYSFPEDSTAPTFGNLPDTTSPINLTEGQNITTNPYIIQVKPSDNIAIQKVEFFVDDILIGTDYNADENGIYEYPWDTSKYHSDIRVVAYDTTGNPSVALTRSVTVDPSLYPTLPSTGIPIYYYLVFLVIPTAFYLTRRYEKTN